ncbi:MAG: potassium channel family protein [Roseovarius sp.]|uniref:potassium channel family protein n=1 Tax=Roseovarius sp. TaxID=1486281 RepID=UPI0040584CCD
MRARTLLILLAAVIVGGTVFFRLVEGWSWLDSYFFTVVTLSTVGYGNLVPATVAGKIGTTVFIITGLGIFAAAIQRFGFHAIARHRREGEAEAEARHTHAAQRSKKK